MMEFLLEILSDIAEVFLEVVWEGIIEVLKSRKVPLFLRILLLTFLCAVPIGICIVVLFSCIDRNSAVGTAVCGGLTVLMLLGWLAGLIWLIRHS